LNGTLKKKIKKIKLLILDVDGILTKGDIVYDHNGDEIKFFNVHDGFAIVLFQKAGYKTAIITARYSKAVEARARDLGVAHIYQNAHPKTEAYTQLMQELKLKDEQACFVGDDLPDLGVLKKVGFAITVPNGVKEVADHVTKNFGGYGAVREVVELILKTQGKWKGVVQSFAN